MTEVGLPIVAHTTRRERGVTLDEQLGWHMLPNVEKTGGEDRRQRKLHPVY